MKTHSDFFTFRKIDKKNHHNLSIKYTQLPTFLPKNNFLKNEFFNSSKSKENKRYYLNNNRIPLLKQKNIKSFSLAKKSINLDNFFHIS